MQFMDGFGVFMTAFCLIPWDYASEMCAPQALGHESTSETWVGSCGLTFSRFGEDTALLENLAENVNRRRAKKWLSKREKWLMKCEREIQVP